MKKQRFLWMLPAAAPMLGLCPACSVREVPPETGEPSVSTLSPDTSTVLRTFVSGEGYYDLEMATEEKTLWMEPYLERSEARIPTPGCILESTWYLSPEEQQAGAPHRLGWYDGEQWREVKLPEEWATQNGEYGPGLLAVTTQGIFFMRSVKSNGSYVSNLYFMAYGEDPEVVLYAQFS